VIRSTPPSSSNSRPQMQLPPVGAVAVEPEGGVAVVAEDPVPVGVAVPDEPAVGLLAGESALLPAPPLAPAYRPSGASSGRRARDCGRGAARSSSRRASRCVAIEGGGSSPQSRRARNRRQSWR
jgi:hypothetical protein